MLSFLETVNIFIVYSFFITCVLKFYFFFHGIFYNYFLFTSFNIIISRKKKVSSTLLCKCEIKHITFLSVTKNYFQQSSLLSHHCSIWELTTWFTFVFNYRYKWNYQTHNDNESQNHKY